MSALFVDLLQSRRLRAGTLIQQVYQEVGDGVFFFLLALQLPLGVVFYSPLVGFSLLACEVS